MVSFVIPLASQDADMGSIGITWTKSHVAPHFNHLDLRNAMVPLKTFSASCDASSSIIGVTWSESHVAPCFDHLYVTDAIVPLMTLLV